jgi:hypothetical protein
VSQRTSQGSRRPGKRGGKPEPPSSPRKDTVASPASSDPLSASDSKKDSPRAHLPEVEIDFAELQDGSLAEMIEDPAIPTESLLAFYKDGTVQYAEKWRNAGRVLVPLRRAGPVLRHICLPAGCESYGGIEELLGVTNPRCAGQNGKELGVMHGAVK